MSNEKSLNELVDRLQTGQLTRRGFIRALLALGVSAAAADALAACAPSTPTAPTSAPAQSTAAPAAPAPTAAAGAQAAAAGGKKGGIMKRGLQPPTNLDPAFQANPSDISEVAQMYDWFVWIDDKNQPVPALATGWEANKDGTVWTFEMRKGVTFHNGKSLTVDDVIFTFNRLRDKSVGAATVPLYANISDIKAVDATHVQFTLAQSNPDLPADMGDYHSAIVDSTQKDFKTNHNGTGPFILDSYTPEDRAVFKRNPNYWMQGLPYLDGLQDIYSPQPAAQVEALRGGQLDMVQALPADLAETIRQEGKFTLLRGRTNTHYAIRMRVDHKPANDPKVVQALKLGTDRSAILQVARLGYGVVGLDTPIGPMYGDYFLNVPEPKRDVEKAKALLKEAGYDNNLKITLVTQNSVDVPKIATVWKQQMADIGVNVDINLIPQSNYFQNDEWLQVDFGITDWGSRATPQPYLQLAYVTGAKWNETHWSDKELDTLAAQAASEMDHAKRVDLYHSIQKIFMERGPVIIAYFQDSLVATSPKLKGIAVHPDVARTTLRSAYFEG